MNWRRGLVLLFILTLPAFAPLLRPGYFPMHDDLQVMRLYQMSLCFVDGQFPCRWVPDMGRQYGYPLFIYYPPGPYYLGQLFHSLGFSFVDSVKLLGVSGFVFGSLGAYLLLNRILGPKAGLFGSLLYTYAPYHSVDWYVRGAVNEFWAISFFPWIFYTAYQFLITRKSIWSIPLALSIAGLALSHNQMLMIFAPVLLIWLFIWWWRRRDLRTVVYLIFAAVIAFGLSAFYTLPALLEQSYIHLNTIISGYFNYINHFLDLRQLFLFINWGYGSSNIGPDDTMSFALGYLHWLLPLIAFLSVIFVSRLRSWRPFISLGTLVWLGTVFMTHARSSALWALMPPLAYLQFPWRFLALALFLSPLVAAPLICFYPRRFVAPFLLALVLFFNAPYFTPLSWRPQTTDRTKLGGSVWQDQISAAIFDYLPHWAPMPPGAAATKPLLLTTGSGRYLLEKFSSHRQDYRLIITSPSARVQLQTYYFPGWQVWVDDQPITLDPWADPQLGRIEVPVSAGPHTLSARFTSTPVRFWADRISAAAWAALLVIISLWMGKRMKLIWLRLRRDRLRGLSPLSAAQP